VGRPVALGSTPASLGAMPASSLLNPLASSTEVEQFLAISGSDGESAQRLRMLPANYQRIVMERGPILGSRNPSSVLIARIRDVEMGRITAPPPGFGGSNLMLGSSSNPEIEKLIKQYNLDPSAAGMLRSLPPERQRIALQLPLHEVRNPSAMVMKEMAASNANQAAVQQSTALVPVQTTV